MEKLVVVVGSINVDLACYTAGALPCAGETVQGTQFTRNHGGKGSNVAVQAALLGSQVCFVGRIGETDDFGSLKNLQKYGIDTTMVRNTAGVETGVAVITVDTKGENTIVVVPGANGALTPVDVEIPERARVAVSNLEVPMEVAAFALEKASSCLSVLNPSPFPPGGLSGALVAATDLLVVNRTELALLLGLAVEECEAIEPLLAKALDLGFQQIVVTLGSEGIWVAPPAVFVECSVAPRGVVDTTGAGDSFLGALVHKIVLGETLLAAAQFASRVSAYSVGAKGCQPSYGDKALFQ